MERIDNPDPTPELSDQQHGVDLVFHGMTIAIRSPHQLDKANFMELEESVTGMQTLDRPPIGAAPDGRLSYLPAEDVAVRYSEADRELVLSGPVALFGNGTAIAFTAHYMAECLRSSKTGLMLVHSAAICQPDEDNSYVFLGEKGAGKTTLALRLCHQYNFKLIGNDQVFMGPGDDGRLVTHGGNAWFNVRETAVSSDSYLAKLVTLESVEYKPAWNNKVRIDPNGIGIGVEKNKVPVKELFHVRIDHTQKQLQTGPWAGLQRNLALHERLGRHITGQATPLQDDKGNYLGSLPPVNLLDALRARDELVGLVIKTGITEIFAPSSDSAIEYILDKKSTA